MGAEALDLPIPEALVPASRHPFKGNMDVEALERVLAERGRARGVHDAHEQLGRRAAGLDGEPARVREGLRRRAALRRRLPLRRERLVREAARGRLRRHAGPGDRARDGLAGGRHDDVGEEGPARQHRRLAGGRRRRARQGVPHPAGPHRGLPDLRRHGRPRHGRGGPGPARGRRRGLPPLPHPLDRVPRRGARRGGDPGRAARRRARRLHRRTRAPAAHPAARVPGAGARPWPSTSRAASAAARSAR